MDLPSRIGTVMRSGRVRTWTIRIVVALSVLEVIYVVGANVFLHTDLLRRLINTKPEKTHVSWDSAVTYFPGFASVDGFTLRSQTKAGQVYIHVAEANARISMIELIFKTVHIRGVDANGVDFRYRERLDRPPKAGQKEQQAGQPAGVEYYPEIPGFTNPPDPKPEDLYPLKRKKRPWVIAITGARVDGPVRVALNTFRLEGEGWVGGGVTVKPRKTITIHRGRLDLDSAAVSVGPEVVADDLSINGDFRIEPFPDRGAKFSDVIGGISGTLSIAGRIGEKAAVKQEITPGITTVGAGSVTANLRFKDGVLRAGSQYSLQSDAFHLRIMDLDATGSAEISGRTAKEGGDHVTSMNVSFGAFEFVDPDDESADITGTGLELNARWNGLSLAGEVPASHVELEMPAAHIHDMAAFNGLIPGEHTLSLESGTGEARARLEVNQRLAVGTLDLTAEDIVMQAQDVPLRGNLEVHANLGDGNLSRKEFDISGTTIRLDHIVGEDLSPQQEKNLGAWYCDVELRKGTVTLGKPLEADGQIRLKMYDTRPVVAILREFGTGPKWLSMMPNVKDVEAAMDVGVGKGRTAVDDLVLTGNKLEVLGWIHIQDKKANGRLLIEYGILSAGVALEQGKGTVRISKPRKWFEEQPKSPQGAGGSAPLGGS